MTTVSSGATATVLNLYRSHGPSSIGECTERVFETLNGLANENALCKPWLTLDPGYARVRCKQFEDIARCIDLALVDLDDDSPIEQPYYDARFFNGRDDSQKMQLSVRFSPRQRELQRSGLLRVDLQLGGAFGPREPIERADWAKQLFTSMVLRFEPIWGSLRSEDLPDLGAEQSRRPVAGWLTFLANRPSNLRTILQDMPVESIGKGALIVADGEWPRLANAQGARLVSRIQRVLQNLPAEVEGGVEALRAAVIPPASDVGSPWSRWADPPAHVAAFSDPGDNGRPDEDTEDDLATNSHTTALPPIPRDRAALPFEARATPAPDFFAAIEADRSHRRGSPRPAELYETAPLPSLVRAAVLPMARPKTTALTLPDLTLEQYASFRAEIGASPDNTTAILRRYGIDGETAMKTLDLRFAEQMQRDPSMLTRFAQAVRRYQEWIKTQGKAP